MYTCTSIPFYRLTITSHELTGDRFGQVSNTVQAAILWRRIGAGALASAHAWSAEGVAIRVRRPIREAAIDDFYAK